MTLKQLKTLYTEHDTFLFYLRDVYSWRGDYTKVAFTPSIYGTKTESLQLINRALSEIFQAWKGGYYTYNLDTKVEFETDSSAYNSGALLNVLKKQAFMNYVDSKRQK